MSVTKQISLYYKDGSSDKEYHAQIVDIGNDNYSIYFQYGRRGSTLTAGTKTQKPVGEAQAGVIFEKLVKEKKAKGYTEGESGTPYSGGDKADRTTDLFGQLLNPIDDLKHIINDSNWCAQEKYDGKYMLLRYSEGKVTAINKLGLECGVSQLIVDAYLTNLKSLGMAGETVVHGEAIGDKFWAHDVLIWDGSDAKGLGYLTRHTSLLEFRNSNAFEVAPVVLRYKQKFVDGLRDAGKEGAVFKRLDAPLKPGRPNSGGTQLKYKFVESATCVVLDTNAKRSVQVGVRVGDGKLSTDYLNVGNVTIPPNYGIPKVGDLVEVEYLYVGAGGNLYQPVYKGVRDDQAGADSIDSLKYKGEAKGARA